MIIKSKAFTIVEFLVSISLGALLLSGVVSVYLSNKTTYTLQEGMARLQENGRFIHHLLGNTLRMAGFQGCGNSAQTNVTNLVKNPSSMLNIDQGLAGYEGKTSNWTPALPSHLANLVKVGSDVIEVRMAANTGVQLRRDMNRTNNPVSVFSRADISAGDTLLISDCSVGDLFVAGSNSNATVITHTVANNTSNDLTKSYQMDAQIMKYQYFAFFVGPTGRRNTSNTPIFALFRTDIAGNTLEIAEGVEDLKITYGVDTNNDNAADTYLTATAVNSTGQWEQVISLNVSLLINSINDVSPTSLSYRFNGQNLTPTDRRLRREWPIFISLRNRGLQ